MRIQQVVHGYADGHRQLATSIPLKPRDLKTMLFMSDSAVSGAQIPATGYLTGYPLTESGFYALARTWAAPEKSRPGCVWTHSLLIDFGDLAQLESFESIEKVFKRPREPLDTKYQKPISVSQSLTAAELMPSEANWGTTVISVLYGQPGSKVTLVRPDTLDTEKLVLAIWAQQWPRLRRSFRFCTLTTVDRSSESSEFDLQLYPQSHRSVRSQFGDTAEVGKLPVSTSIWLREATSDLAGESGASLRKFLRTVGSEVQFGREAFAPLCTLYRLINSFNQDNDSLEQAVAIVEKELGVSQARTIHALIANQAAVAIQGIGESGFKFLLAHLELVDQDTMLQAQENIGVELWRRDLDRFCDMLKVESPYHSIPESALHVLEFSELIEGIQEKPQLALPIVVLRPNLVMEPAFWRVVREGIEEAMTLGATSPQLSGPCLRTIVSANRDELLQPAFSHFGPIKVLHALGELCLIETSASGLESWFAAAAKEPEAVTSVLNSSASYSIGFWTCVARASNPDDVPSGLESDPWLTVQRSVAVSNTQHDDVYLYAYILSRALRGRSASCAELILFTFGPIHAAIEYQFMSEEAWALLEQRIPFFTGFFDWDKGRRLHAGIANLFVEKNLSPSLFAHLTVDDYVFDSIVSQALWAPGGRRYIKSTLSSIRNDSSMNARANYLRWKLDK